MKLSEIILLAAASILSFSFFTTAPDSFKEIEVEQPISLKMVIDMTNDKVGTDSVYLSALNTEYKPDLYMISDHLVLVNDMLTETDLFTKNFTFSVEASGTLDLIGFDLKNLESHIINNGSMTLLNCQFQEGKDLTKLITNRGAFSITNGLFRGSSEGEIIRDAVFSHGARLIL